MKKTKFIEVKPKKKIVVRRNKNNSDNTQMKHSTNDESQKKSIFDTGKNIFVQSSHSNKDWAVNGKQIIINEEREIERPIICENNDPKNIPLYCDIALICMWKTKDGEKGKKTISIMKTVYDFFSILETIRGEGECLFNLPLSGCVEEANKIFINFISSNENGNNNNINSREEVAKFNKLHPIWSFVKVSSETTINDDIRIPYISNDKNTLNDININLKEIKNNNTRGIWTMHSSLKNGYIPCMIMDFVRGGMPDEIQALVFHKTIAINKNASYKGFRLRVVVDSVDVQTLVKCKNFIENDFYFFHRNVNYSNCVVRISLPKK